MKMFRLIFLPLLLVSALSAEMTELTLRKRERFPESFVLYLPEGEGFEWRRVHQSIVPEDGFVVCEYVPKDQTVMCWDEMISITYAPMCDPCVHEVLAFTKDQIFTAHRRSHIKWMIHEVNENEIIYEWSLPQGHYRMAPQVHIVRLVATECGVHSVVYTRKTRCLDEVSRDYWLNYLSMAKIQN